MNDHRVSSWAELHEQLFAASWQEPLRRFRSPFAFRGLARSTHDLKTSLFRLGGPFEDKEGHLLRNFRKYASRDAAPGDSVWSWLAVAQHHGLPTRLLDWTYSPFVALHFLTADLATFDDDGLVWCVDYARANRMLPKRLRDVLEEEGSDVFTVEMLGNVADTLDAFDRLAAEPFVIFLEPPSLDARIVNQFALFALMSSASARLDDWLAARPELCRRLVVPARLKWEIRDKLDQANVTERVLFPGLDGLSEWLKRYYSPGPR